MHGLLQTATSRLPCSITTSMVVSITFRVPVQSRSGNLVWRRLSVALQMMVALFSLSDPPYIPVDSPVLSVTRPELPLMVSSILGGAVTHSHTASAKKKLGSLSGCVLPVYLPNTSRDSSHFTKNPAIMTNHM